MILSGCGAPEDHHWSQWKKWWHLALRLWSILHKNNNKNLRVPAQPKRVWHSTVPKIARIPYRLLCESPKGKLSASHLTCFLFRRNVVFLQPELILHGAVTSNKQKVGPMVPLCSSTFLRRDTIKLSRIRCRKFHRFHRHGSIWPLKILLGSLSLKLRHHRHTCCKHLNRRDLSSEITLSELHYLNVSMSENNYARQLW